MAGAPAVGAIVALWGFWMLLAFGWWRGGLVFVVFKADVRIG